MGRLHHSYRQTVTHFGTCLCQGCAQAWSYVLVAIHECAKFALNPCLLVLATYLATAPTLAVLYIELKHFYPLLSQMMDESHQQVLTDRHQELRTGRHTDVRSCVAIARCVWLVHFLDCSQSVLSLLQGVHTEPFQNWSCLNWFTKLPSKFCLHSHPNQQANTQWHKMEPFLTVCATVDWLFIAVTVNASCSVTSLGVYHNQPHSKAIRV